MVRCNWDFILTVRCGTEMHCKLNKGGQVGSKKQEHKKLW